MFNLEILVLLKWWIILMKKIGASLPTVCPLPNFQAEEARVEVFGRNMWTNSSTIDLHAFQPQYYQNTTALIFQT